MKHIKSLKQFIKERLKEKLKEYENSIYIIVEIEKDEFDALNILYEGNWTPSNVKDIWQRVDTPKFDHEKRHIHLAHKKHINTKSKQVAWNDDGKRHDKKTFDVNFKGMETAKKIARDVLKIPDDKILELYTENDKMNLILESIENMSFKSKIVILELKSNKLIKS
ncbi:MAG: DUF6367 family protein [Flavobacterium sp.]|uniref:DUF6367 family protein n=1 Tax=Flavobacterium sp. TaxID=239 RepID=UPI002B48D5C0|nr:DUF6367 family protein [Flavobacterium sp.]WRH73250.1 MAG: DUF6367 family protein [Flavobacterium sp.]